MDISPHKSDFVNANGIRLHYLDWGGNGDVLLFLAGMGCSVHIFDEFAPENMMLAAHALGLGSCWVGFGAMVTDREGAYHFRTLRPVPYTGRTPHIHFRVTAPGFERLTTQLFVAEEAERNRADFLYQRHGAAELARITTRFQSIGSADPGSDAGPLAARFDIVLA